MADLGWVQTTDVLHSRAGRLALLASAAGVFMLNLDVTIVSVALPSIQSTFETRTETLQWVVSAYLVALAGLVVTMGRFGDEHGRRRVFVGGIVAFVAASVLAGAAPSIEWLIAARVLQGVSAAAVQALSLALIADVFPIEQRGRAIGLWSAVASISVALGPVLGGVIVELLGWRCIFLINVPVGAAIVALSLVALPDARGEAGGHDPAGFVTSTVGLTLLLVAVIEGRSWGWGSAATLGALAGGAALLAAFALIELRARAPIADLRLFRLRLFRGANVGMAVSRGTYYAMFFLVPFALQRAARLSPAETGLAMAPMVLTILVASPIAGALADRIGAIRLIAVGFALNALGIGLLATFDVDGALAPVVGALVLFAIGSAAIYAPINAVGIDAVPSSEIGAGSGLMAMVRYVSAASAVAIVASLYQASADHHASGRLDAVRGALGGLSDGDVYRLIAGSDRVRAALEEIPPAAAAQVRAVVREAASAGFSTTMALLAAAALAGGLTAWSILRGPSRGRPRHTGRRPPEDA